ncbi:MAG: DUF547 domain-containing protein [Candidatus Rokubacteria bacterium]|nr:DUF547 domain-containing protein [Candidatus Rokubacteria bacterium]
MVIDHGLQPMILFDVPGPAGAAFTTRAQRLAFWINAYNTLVARGIPALEIRRSIWDVPDFFDRIRLRAGHLVFSLNEIEHGLLRGNRPHPLSTHASRAAHPLRDQLRGSFLPAGPDL